MSWWGKVIGGTFGFMLGGPLGAALGAAVGHNFDKGLEQVLLQGIGNTSGANVEKIQSAFFTATFSMMGHIAKADGQVSPSEISVAQNIMQQMKLNAEQKKVAIKLFNQGKGDNFPVNDILKQFKKECHRQRNLIQMFIEVLIMTALADGHLHEAENKVLRDTAKMLGFSSTDYQQILHRVQAQANYHQNSTNGSPTMSLQDAYKLLSIDQSANKSEIKKAYRRQMNQHHPDKLVSKGLPQEMMDLANQKAQDIKTAYELIKQTRARQNTDP